MPLSFTVYTDFQNIRVHSLFPMIIKINVLQQNHDIKWLLYNEAWHLKNVLHGNECCILAGNALQTAAALERAGYFAHNIVIYFSTIEKMQTKRINATMVSVVNFKYVHIRCRVCREEVSFCSEWVLPKDYKINFL